MMMMKFLFNNKSLPYLLGTLQLVYCAFYLKAHVINCLCHVLGGIVARSRAWVNKNCSGRCENNQPVHTYMYKNTRKQIFLLLRIVRLVEIFYWFLIHVFEYSLNCFFFKLSYFSMLSLCGVGVW